MRGSAHEARTVHHIGAILEDWLNQGWIVGRVIFQVGVLDDHHVTGGVLEAVAQGGAFAFVDGLVNDAEIGLGEEGGELIEFFGGAVFGAVVDADDLAAQAVGDGGVDDQGDQSLDRGFLVVYGDDDGDLGEGRGGGELVYGLFDGFHRFSVFRVPLGKFTPDGGERFYVYRSEEHTSELQSHSDLVCRLLLEKKKKK